MRSRAGTRRRWAGIITIAVTALLAGLLPAAPVSAQDYPEGILPPGNWTQEQADFLVNMVDEAEAVLPVTFPTGVSEAEAESVLEPLGFDDIGVVAPGGYWHFFNRGWIFDEHIFNPEFAESLVYQGTPDHLELVAVMYVLPVASVDDVPEEYRWIPGWHTHPDQCVDRDQLDGPAEPGSTCPPGTAALRPGPMIHVWIVDNECEHRFGGADHRGLSCDGHGHPGGEEHDDGEGHDGFDVAPPAPPVPGTPGFTG